MNTGHNNYYSNNKYSKDFNFTITEPFTALIIRNTTEILLGKEMDGARAAYRSRMSIVSPHVGNKVLAYQRVFQVTYSHNSYPN